MLQHDPRSYNGQHWLLNIHYPRNNEDYSKITHIYEHLGQVAEKYRVGVLTGSLVRAHLHKRNVKEFSYL